ncbi:flagellar biosynthesis protein FlhB [Thorsellia anophelis]|uniref:Flagellar biosynthetic protein FlhB n=1 Tax=Thorsellia anophelis DSM 18579 TaxID=1123402 RepID=A0A1I0BWQ0_9GAMM|nr:flagellar biosynthesis protein FlhB [Thorsellia anophelis]SET11577.1 flagellar biosynthetic protein FlhB [Thorsellia anophelis DSM 18579]
MAEDSDLEKTESPTQHKIDKAREKGQIARSRELTSVLMVLAGLSVFLILGKELALDLSKIFITSLNFDASIVLDTNQLLNSVVYIVELTITAMLPIFLTLVIFAIFSPMLLGGVLFNPSSIKFDMKKWNPISGLKRIFSSQMLAELIKGILKAGLVSIVIYLFISSHLDDFLALMYESPVNALGHFLTLIIFCGYYAMLGLVPMVAFDIVYQLWSHFKKLKMTKQEIKDEHKQHEGDPYLKARIRQLQRAMARQRMMADVPTADVIVTNPTHFAVALRYDEAKMQAPKVVAKGMGEIALKIKELGIDNKVPILEAPPLARTLYRYTEIGSFIPANLYAAVAEVLAWVYQLKYWKKYGGDKPKSPENLPIPETMLDTIRGSDGESSL